MINATHDQPTTDDAKLPRFTRGLGVVVGAVALFLLLSVVMVATPSLASAAS